LRLSLFVAEQDAVKLGFLGRKTPLDFNAARQFPKHFGGIITKLNIVACAVVASLNRLRLGCPCCGE